MNPCRLFHYIGTLDIGGEQTYLIRLVNHMPDRFQHTIAYSYSDRMRDLIKRKVEYVKITQEKLSASNVKTYSLFYKFYRILNAAKHDFVITYSPGVPAFICHLVGHCLGIPVIHVPQRAYGNQSRLERLTTSFQPLRWISYRMVDQIVALGSYYKDDFLRNWKIPEGKISMNYIGIDLEEYQKSDCLRRAARDAYRLGDDTVVLGYIGRLHPIKGLDKVLDMLKAANRHNWNRKLALWIAGDGPYRDFYKNRVKDESLGNVRFLGYRSDIDVVMNAIDIYVQATDNPLNGISSIEAMACGKPILTLVRSDDEMEMAADTVVESRNGCFLRLRDLDRDLETKLNRMIDPDELSRMGQESRRMAMEKFDIQRHVIKFCDLLENRHG